MLIYDINLSSKVYYHCNTIMMIFTLIFENLLFTSVEHELSE